MALDARFLQSCWQSCRPEPHPPTACVLPPFAPPPPPASLHGAVLPEQGAAADGGPHGVQRGAEEEEATGGAAGAHRLREAEIRPRQARPSAWRCASPLVWKFIHPNKTVPEETYLSRIPDALG